MPRCSYCQGRGWRFGPDDEYGGACRPCHGTGVRPDGLTGKQLTTVILAALLALWAAYCALSGGARYDYCDDAGRAVHRTLAEQARERGAWVPSR